MAALLALLLTITPAASPTSWMTLPSFHLTIGMPRAEALAAVRAWNPKEGRNANEIFVDYSSDKALTLEFEKDRLKAVRFELFVFMPHLRKAFDEQKALLQKSLGDPRKATRSILIYDTTLPNVMVVAADDPRSTHGKKGLGVLAVRYFDPR